MGAAQRVFDICELLDIIICQVEQHQIPELKLVARNWRDLISSSKAVHRARVCQSYESDDPFEGQDVTAMSQEQLDWARSDADLQPAITTTIYEALDWIRVNPVFDMVHARCYQLNDGAYNYGVVIRLPSSTDTRIVAQLDEYATAPPCRNMTMALMSWDSDTTRWTLAAGEANYCWADNIEGLKVKDLLEVRDQILAQDSSHSTNDGFEIVAGYDTQGIAPGEGTCQDQAVNSSYFVGPLPRYRKASHKLGRQGVAAFRKDEELLWDPSMDE